MRQRFGIIIAIVLAIGLLVAINSVAYVSEETKPDSETVPNRSTYNAGATGTRALYDLLAESGYKAMRWREVPEKILGDGGQQVQTFVIIGNTPVSVAEDEAKSLLLWVERGGRLVIIDRRPEPYLLPPSGDWTINTEFLEYPGFGVDPANPEQMTEGIKPLRPVQPTLLTRDVEAVMPSKFFAEIKFSVPSKDATGKNDQAHNKATEGDGGPPPEAANPGNNPKTNEAKSTKPTSPAPVVHLASSGKVLLIDYPHGQGRIVVLSDPFIVANDGIGLKDNLQLAINLLSSSEGVIAFDEFHQGRGVMRNAFVSYFEGTPVLAIFGQLVLIILLMVWTRGRRFARPLPLPAVDRRSSLEFVASMAELQQRARAHDLALENIYGRVRRVLVRHAGLNQGSPRAAIAARVAARSGMNQQKLETLMRNCEDAINGAPTNAKEALRMVRRLRQVESALGLRARERDTKQQMERSEL